ncbi:MAG: pyruvate kinase alpha/beta domain-containing protein, partial [Phycisphaerales bacterium]
MAMLRGVTPVCTQPPTGGSITGWIQWVDQYLLSRSLAQPGDPIVLLAGRPLGQAKKTNTITIHRVAENLGFSEPRGQAAKN